jgi:hypothetical protein
VQSDTVFTQCSIKKSCNAEKPFHKKLQNNLRACSEVSVTESVTLKFSFRKFSISKCVSNNKFVLLYA